MGVKNNLDVHKRLRQILQEKGWSEYRLAKESGLSQSTIANIFRRNTLPSIQTIAAICDGLDISVAQFFAEGELVEMTPEKKIVINAWDAMGEQHKSSFLAILQSLAK